MNESKNNSPLSTIAHRTTPSRNVSSSGLPESVFSPDSARAAKEFRANSDLVLKWVESNIHRRAQVLEEDLKQNVLVENRLISDQLSSIPGLKRHLSHAKMAKVVYESQTVSDIQGHGTLTRAELHHKYHYPSKR